MEDSSSRSGKGSTHLDQCGYCGGDIDEEDQEYVGCEEADRCHSPSDWFHLACAGLKEVPAEEVPWVCAECRKHKKGKRPVKRRKLDIDSDLSKEAGFAAQPRVVEKIDIPEQEQNTPLKRWLAEIEKGTYQLLPGLSPNYTATGTSLLTEEDMESQNWAADILELPVRDGRDYVVHNVECVKSVLRQGDGKKNPTPHFVNVGMIRVRNRNNPQEPILTLYGPEPAGVSHPWALTRGGILDEGKVYSSPEDLQQLGNAAVRILNRWPGSLNVDNWHTALDHNAPIHRIVPRHCAELWALHVWKPDFDYRLLHSLYLDPPKGMRACRSALAFRRKNILTSTVHVAVVMEGGKIEWNTGNNGLEIRHSMKGAWDLPRIAALPDIPDSFVHKPTTIAKGETHQTQWAAYDETRRQASLKVLQHVSHQMFRKIGTLGGLNSMAIALINSYLKGGAPDLKMDTPGPTNFSTYHGISVIENSRLARTSVSQQGTVMFVPTSIWKRFVKPMLHTYSVATSSAMEVSYIYNEMHNDLYKQQKVGTINLLQTWQAGLRAGALVHKHKVPVSDMIVAQHLFDTDGDRDKCGIACALCWRVCLVKDLRLLPDGRLICDRHPPADELSRNYARVADLGLSERTATCPIQNIEFRDDDILFLQRNGALTASLRAVTAREGLLGSGQVDQGAIHADLRSNCVRDATEGIWYSHQLQKKFSIADAAYSEADLALLREGRRPRHHDQASLEGLWPVLFIDQRIYKHRHPSNGERFITLEPDWLNFMKAQWPPIIVILMGIAARQTSKEKAQQESGQGSWHDTDFWSWWHNAVAHVYRLCLLYPYKNATRFRMPIPPPHVCTLFMEALRNGTWSQELQDQMSWKNNHRERYRTTADNVSEKQLLGVAPKHLSLRERYLAPDRLQKLAGRDLRKDFPEWREASRKAEFIDMVTQIEQHYGHKVPRWNNTELPWTFLLSDMPTNELDPWEWWKRQGLAHFWRADNDCDLENLHLSKYESPMTFALLFIVTYCKNKGVDRFIHCGMVPWQRSPLKSSIGRDGHVAAGTEFATGFTKQWPTRFPEDFDESIRTTTVQPLIVNYTWKDYPISAHSEIFIELCDIPESNDFANKPDRQRETEVLKGPDETLLSRKMRRQQSGTVDVDDEDAASDAEDESGVSAADGQPINVLAGDQIQESAPSQEVQDELREFLRDQLEILVNDLKATAPNKVEDDFVKRLLTGLEAAVQSADQVAFDDHQRRLQDFVNHDKRRDPVTELTSELDALRTSIQAGYEQSANDAEVLDCLKRMEAAAANGRRGEFDAVWRQVLAYLENKSTGPTVLCFVCHEAVRDTSIMCKTPGHQDRAMHYTCLGFMTQPAYEDWLCPDCRSNGIGETTSEGPTVPALKNLVNLGQSCYCSSSIIFFFGLQPIFSFIMNSSNDSGQLASQSGRNAIAFLSSQFKGYGDIAAADSINMANVKAMYEGLRDLFGALGALPASPTVDRQQMKDFFALVNQFDHDFVAYQPNCAAHFFRAILRGLILYTDRSTPATRIAANGRIDKTLDGQSLPALGQDSANQFDAYKQQGGGTALFDLFCTQYVVEYMCETCKIVHRNWFHHLDLQFGFEDNNGADISLKALMAESWPTEHHGRMVACTHNDRNAGTMVLHKRITRSPQYLPITFVRGNERGMEFGLKHNDIPEFLNISAIANGAALPSDHFHPLQHLAVDCIYRLVGVNVFLPNGRHYVAYVVQHDAWIKFDDMSPDHPRKEHPQASINAGGIPYFVIYEKQTGQNSLPYDRLTNEQTEGFLLVARGLVPSYAVGRPLWRKMNDAEAKAAAEEARKEAEEAQRAARERAGQKTYAEAVESRRKKQEAVDRSKQQEARIEQQVAQLQQQLARVRQERAADEAELARLTKVVEEKRAVRDEGSSEAD